MSSENSNDISSNDLTGQICDNCGEQYTHETIADPGEGTRSCGCDVVLFEVADNTKNTLANVAIRAMNASGDPETAARIHEGTRGRLVADGGHEPNYECRHCDWAGDECDRRDHYPICPECRRIVEVRQKLVADGGVPESFESLASTCESCGDDVDTERLIEGECPGCHYRPMADGGTAWTDLTGFERDLLEAIRRLDNDNETTFVYGLAIKEELERVYTGEVNHGRLYPNLDDLVEYGLVEKSELDARTNQYELTSEAEAMLEQRARLLADACGLEQPVADGGESA